MRGRQALYQRAGSRHRALQDERPGMSWFQFYNLHAVTNAILYNFVLNDKTQNTQNYQNKNYFVSKKVYYFMNDKRFHKRILIETNR